jgi:DNA-binding MarR family transcriptional regulator
MKLGTIRTRLDRVGLSFEEAVLLEMIQDMGDEKVSANPLGSDGVRVMAVVARSNNLRFASPTTVQTYMGSLNRKNYIRKEADEKDKRIMWVSITGLGEELLESLQQ